MNLVSSTGAPLLNNTFTDQDLQLVSKAVLDACDALDGLVDGMVNKPLACTTAVVTPVLNALQCAGAKTPTCLTAGQIDAVQKIYGDPVTPGGQHPYFPWMWDPGIAGCTSATDCNTPSATNIATGWRSWKIGSFQSNLATATNNALDFTGAAGGAFLTVVAPTPPILPAPTANEGVFKVILNFDLDAFYASIFNTTSDFPRSTYTEMTVDSTDLSALRNHGGKVIIYQPQTGGPFSPLAMIDWYNQLNAASGGTATDYSSVQSYARLFLMPGAQHCGGGPSTSTIDPFSAVVNWAENGVAPARIVGTAPNATPWPGRTRPLCPFPAYAKYSGSGSIESEANFVCTVE
jgi:feruloyl esterase